jgi:predicted acetyltransferase
MGWVHSARSTSRAPLVSTMGGCNPQDCSVPELIEPTARLEAAWREAHEEWGPGLHEDGFDVRPSDDVDTSAGFAAWVKRLVEQVDRTLPLDSGRVRCTNRWIVEGDQVLGGIALRHELDEALLHAGGHIGYGIRPSARRRGVATWALGRMLDEARSLGLNRVLLVCADNNAASARTIEHHGGALEDVRATELGLARRYWIAVT